MSVINKAEMQSRYCHTQGGAADHALAPTGPLSAFLHFLEIYFGPRNITVARSICDVYKCIDKSWNVSRDSCYLLPIVSAL